MKRLDFNWTIVIKVISIDQLSEVVILFLVKDSIGIIVFLT